MLKSGPFRKEVCAVRALLLYRHRREGDAGPLFRHITGMPPTRTISQPSHENFLEMVEKCLPIVYKNPNSDFRNGFRAYSLS